MQLLVLAPKSGVYQTVFQNHSGFKKQVPEGPCLGEEEEAEVLLIPEPGESDLDLAELLRQSRPPLQQNPGGKKKRSSFKPLSYLSCPHLMQSCSESSPTSSQCIYFGGWWACRDGSCQYEDGHRRYQPQEATPKTNTFLAGTGQKAENYVAEWSHPAISLTVV